MQKIEIHRLGEADCPAAARLIEDNLSETWSLESLIRRTGLEYDRSLVAAVDGEPAGIIVAELLLGEIAIEIVACDKKLRRMGVASALLRELLSEEHDRAVLEVRASNAPAIALYTKAGFVQSGVRRGFYSDPDEDGIVMVRTV